MKKIEKQLQDILEIKKIDPKKKVSSLKNWDSIIFLQLITLAQNEYKIKINGNALENLETLSDLITLFKK